MLLETLSVQVDIPEPLDVLGYRGIDTVIIGQDAVRVASDPEYRKQLYRELGF